MKQLSLTPAPRSNEDWGGAQGRALLGALPFPLWAAEGWQAAWAG